MTRLFDALDAAPGSAVYAVLAVVLLAVIVADRVVMRCRP